MKKEDNYPEENLQEKYKISSLKKILFSAVFAAVSVTTCGCEYTAGYRTYPRYYYEYRSPLIHPPSYRVYPRYDYRYREYNPYLELRIRPNIQRPHRNYSTPHRNHPTPHRNPSTHPRPERHRK